VAAALVYTVAIKSQSNSSEAYIGLRRSAQPASGNTAMEKSHNAAAPKTLPISKASSGPAIMIALIER
jgi:hypothetical protein